MILGMTVLTFLSSGPMWKALLMAAFGLFLSTIGMDNVSGIARLSFNIEELIHGILPGAGAIISSFASYAVEKKISKHPEKFGTGVIEGVAGPESANNAATGGAFVPLLSLGIPGNAVMALLLGL